MKRQVMLCLRRVVATCNKNRNGLLTGAGLVTMGIGCYLFVKETPKVELLKEELYRAHRDDPPLYEKIFVVIRGYAPAFGMIFLSGTCFVSASYYNQARIDSLIVAYGALSHKFSQYRAKLTEEEDAEIIAELDSDLAWTKAELQKSQEKIKELQGDVQFWEPFYGDFFWMKKEDLIMAIFKLNQKFSTDGYICLNDFYDLVGLEDTNLGMALGWSAEAGEAFYGYSFVELEPLDHICYRPDGSKYIHIHWKHDPTPDYLADYGCDPFTL